MAKRNRASQSKYAWACTDSPTKYVNMRHIMYVNVIVYATPDKSTFSDENDIMFLTSSHLKIQKKRSRTT